MFSMQLLNMFYQIKDLIIIRPENGTRNQKKDRICWGNQQAYHLQVLQRFYKPQKQVW